MAEEPRTPAMADLVDLAFADLAGWQADDHAEAFAAFLMSARQMLASPPAGAGLGVDVAALCRAAVEALDLPQPVSTLVARRFFERRFRPVAVRPRGEPPFLTGYFEPEVDGALRPTERFRYPLYRRPDDLVDIDAGNRPSGWDIDNRFARRDATGLLPYHDRAAIEDGALAGRGLELVYLADPIDAFFIHVQGSASIRLAEGGRMRVAYAAKAGHAYTSIGKRLIERGLASPDTMTLQTLRTWLDEHPVDGAQLMRENRSYVFFAALPGNQLPALGAVAAAGVQITPGRSLAIDHRQHVYGTPIWLDARLPVGEDAALRPVRRLMIAQDTGSAIVGPARGDMFIGLGAAAGVVAGRLRHQPEAFVMLKPI